MRLPREHLDRLGTEDLLAGVGCRLEALREVRLCRIALGSLQGLRGRSVEIGYRQERAREITEDPLVMRRGLGVLGPIHGVESGDVGQARLQAITLLDERLDLALRSPGLAKLLNRKLDVTDLGTDEIPAPLTPVTLRSGELCCLRGIAG
jgi:hypothetical protein